MTKYVRLAGIFLCDLAIVFIAIHAAGVVLMITVFTEQNCRMSFDRVGEYPAIAEACKDPNVRYALIVEDFEHRRALRAEMEAAE